MIFIKNPLHPYTKLLLSSIPTIDEDPLVEPLEIKGEIPSPINLPKGCYSHKIKKHNFTIMTMNFYCSRLCCNALFSQPTLFVLI